MIHDSVVSPVTPVKVTVLQTLLNGYDDAEYLIDGFTHGFKLGYMGPRHSSFAENLSFHITILSVFLIEHLINALSQLCF